MIDTTPILATWFRKKLSPGFLPPIYGHGVYPCWAVFETDADLAFKEPRDLMIETMERWLTRHRELNEAAGIGLHFYDVVINNLEPGKTVIAVGLQSREYLKFQVV